MGFVAHLRGARSNELVRTALKLLERLEHRSAVGSDAATSDGSGILLQLPHAFLRGAAARASVALPDAGQYGVGMIFLPRQRQVRRDLQYDIEGVVRSQGLRVLGWRDVPVDERALGATARRTRPAVAQLFVAPLGIDLEQHDASAFERTLYVVRRAIENVVRAGDSEHRAYVASLSSRTIVYKGLVRPSLLASCFTDLADPELLSALALVHSRFSTNTFPTWERAHPYRYLCHNGEINTLSGNLRSMRVAEEQMESPKFPKIGAITPVIEPGQSDSASLDNALELLVQGGRSLPHAMLMLIPEAWEADTAMSPDRRAFFDYHASLMEPWDGPAAVAFTDGRQIGAMLDRNGLRPGRYVVTDDDLVILASEAGAVDIPIEHVRARGRLRPGNMLLVNTTQGRLVDGDELKSELAGLHPYQRWIAEQRVTLRERTPEPGREGTTLAQRHAAFRYGKEDMAVLLAPMATNGEEPTGSMGNDTPLAVLSDRAPLLFSYFRQLFAQVTNPAIDPIREQGVMSLQVRLGPRRNLLDASPEHARQIVVEQPILSAAMYAGLRHPSHHAAMLEMLFRAAGGTDALEYALQSICRSAAAAARNGAELVILSDAGMDATWAPIPSLLAASAVHQHLLRARLRSRVSIVVDAGDTRDVSQIALLLGYGCSAIYPRVALETVAHLAASGDLPDGDADHAQAAYVKALDKGLLKIMSKMGISTLRSYTGAQIFEAVGLSRALVDKYFAGTSSKLGGIDLDDIAEDVVRAHARAFPGIDPTPTDDGQYHYRARGEKHQWNPKTIATLQHATRSGRYETFKAFTRAADDAATQGHTLRGLLALVERDPVPLSEVEPATEVVRRFVTGAMSFGSLSLEAHETLAIAMNRIGGRSNTGEGGESAARFGTERNSAIKQVASARFGVTTEYLVNAHELQIKIAQGAKPGEGGQLPGHKVDELIARTRNSIPGVTLISPPPHHDIYSIEDLAQLIFDLRQVNPTAAISVKLVAEAGVGTVAVGVAKAKADLITISGDSGGTGASPLSSIKHAGIPWELGLAETQQALVENGLRGHVRLQTDGQLKTGRDVVIAALLGADEFGFATAPLIVQGCVMMRKCHLNTCPVGIATQDPELRAQFAGKPEHLVNYFFFVAEEVRELLASLGARTVGEIVGRTDLLRQRTVAHARARRLDLSVLLAGSASRASSARRGQNCHEDHMAVLPSDRAVETLAAAPVGLRMTALARPALEDATRVAARLPIANTDRAIGAALSGEIARRYGSAGLPDDTITLKFDGSAGQSFGAFAARGLTLELHGEANDYVGKGLSGGRLIVRPPRGAMFIPDETVIVGNTVLYGATSGEAFFGGVAGERFAVRNSGATAVVEGVGDHGCEYMTGGVVVVLGRTGRNFAAGMSGGVAYVLDASGDFASRCNRAIGDLTTVSESADVALLRQLVERHARYTGSARARHLLSRWEASVSQFVRVIPREYLEALRAADKRTETGSRSG